MKDLVYDEPYPQNVVTVGLTDVLELRGSPATDVVISDPAVAQLVPGTSPGTVGVMILREGAFSVIVKPKPGEEYRRENYYAISIKLRGELEAVKSLVDGIPGIHVNVFHGVVKISGELTNSKTVIRDYDRIYQAETLFTCLNTATIGDSLYEEAANEMQREIDKVEGAGKVKVRVLNRTFLLEGETASSDVREQAEVLVQALLPPYKGSVAIRDNSISLGAKKYAIRNLIQVNTRTPASACPKN